MASTVGVHGLHAYLRKRLGEFELNTEVRARPGEPVALLGLNGSGKSTCLRLLAGLVQPDQGHIQIGSTVWFDSSSRLVVPAERRAIGMVFQNYALFPHLSALDNVVFGLRRSGVGRSKARQQAMHELERLGIGDLADRQPAQLSGGQQQRVALARALALQPEVLLMDEPLAALDMLTRSHVRSELQLTLASLQIPIVLVTHDPMDALVLGSHIQVLDQGRTVQEGSRDELLRHPRSPFVATLLGVNLFSGTAAPIGDGLVRIGAGEAQVFAASSLAGPVHAAVYPWDITLHAAQPGGSARNVFPVQVAEVIPLGRGVRVALRGPIGLVAEVTPAAVEDLAITTGARMWASFKAMAVEVYE